MTLIPDALGSSMQEPSSPDPTSAPAEQVPAGSGIAKVLGARKKKGFGPNLKNPGPLAGAIARAKKARQSGQKWG